MNATIDEQPKKRPNPILIGALALSIAAGLVNKFEPGMDQHVVYHDPIATSRVATVCKGHTGPDVIVGKWYSDEECNTFEVSDLRHAYNAVYRCTYILLTPEQTGALTDFALNEGGERLCDSTMLRLANAGYLPSVWCQQLMRFNRAGGHVRRGLIRRRRDEYNLCVLH